LDASVVVPLVLDEGETREIRGLYRDLIRGESELFAPELLFAECANVLWKYVRWRGLSPIVARRLMDEIREFAIQLSDLRTVCAAALHLGCETNMTPYDACYAVVAMQNEASLITADKRFATQLKASSIEVFMMNDLLAGR
jgi:predicted nucleic acid-binding protein